jgi:hypothetical protein
MNNPFEGKHHANPPNACRRRDLAGLLVTAGCAVQPSKKTVDSYVDDTAITTQVKAKFASDKVVSAWPSTSKH